MPTITRDFPVKLEGDNWRSQLIIGERTGRRWVKFTDGGKLSPHIYATEDTLLDPMEWR